MLFDGNRVRGCGQHQLGHLHHWFADAEWLTFILDVFICDHHAIFSW